MIRSLRRGNSGIFPYPAVMEGTAGRPASVDAAEFHAADEDMGSATGRELEMSDGYFAQAFATLIAAQVDLQRKARITNDPEPLLQSEG